MRTLLGGRRGFREGPVRLAPGQGRVTVQIALPPGYKVNDEAPSSVQWQVEGSALSLAAGASPFVRQEFYCVRFHEWHGSFPDFRALSLPAAPVPLLVPRPLVWFTEAVSSVTRGKDQESAGKGADRAIWLAIAGVLSRYTKNMDRSHSVHAAHVSWSYAIFTWEVHNER